MLRQSQPGSISRHTLQILAKRAEIMRDYINDPATLGRINARMLALRGEAQLRPWPLPNVWLSNLAEGHRWVDERILVLPQVPAVARSASRA